MDKKRKGHYWTPQQRADLASQKVAGMTLDELAKFHEVSITAIRIQIKKHYASTEPSKSAKDYLRGKYGAYRGHFAWRELEQAFDAGRLSQQLAQEPSPRDVKNAERKNWTTKDWMNHVGAWETDRDTIEFGSVMAVAAMLTQFAQCLAWQVQQPAQEPSCDLPLVTLNQIQKVRTTHSDDLAVDKFAEAMKAKLEVSRRVHGRGGWDNKAICSEEQLQGLLLGHVAKGDPVDVGNFAMMLFNRGENTKFQIETQKDPEPFQLPRNDTILNILARPNFGCISLANSLRKKGHKIANASEIEQSEVIFWMLNLFLKHGENWAQVGYEYLNPLPSASKETSL